MGQVVTPLEGQLDVLPAIITAQLNTGHLHLFENDFTPGVNSVLVDFIESTAGAYAAAAVAVWNPPAIDPDGSLLTTAPSHHFTTDGTTPGKTAFGWFYTDVAGHVIAAKRFDDAPRPFGAVTDAIDVVASYPANATVE